MANNYYSGQGSVYVSERDTASGAPLGFLAVGNVPELEISIEVTKFEHKESESGNRAIDLSIVQEKKGTFRMLVENISLDNLALGFWGHTVEIAAEVAKEVQITAPLDLAMGMSVPIGAVNVSNVSVGDASTPITTYVIGVDYTIDEKYGMITPIDGGAIIGGQTMFIDYDSAATKGVVAFTENSMERYVRFEGLNTIDGTKDVLINMFRVQLDPLTGYQLINEELAQMELTGSLLYDSKQSGDSKFFEQVEVSK